MYGSMQHFVLMEDNYGPHRAIAISNYMKTLRVMHMECPPQNPDLNSIENAWVVMKDNFRKQQRHPKNQDERWAAIQALWNEITLLFSQELIGSMASRIQSVLDRNEVATKY